MGARHQALSWPNDSSVWPSLRISSQGRNTGLKLESLSYLPSCLSTLFLSSSLLLFFTLLLLQSPSSPLLLSLHSLSLLSIHPFFLPFFPSSFIPYSVFTEPMYSVVKAKHFTVRSLDSDFATTNHITQSKLLHPSVVQCFHSIK